MKDLIKVIFYIVFLIGMVALGIMLKQMNQLVDSATNSTEIVSSYNLLQKQIGIANITFFVVLLIGAFIHYYKKQDQKLILMANILFIAISLFLYTTLNQKFYQLIDAAYKEQSGYWLTLFMGIFYILGGILISAIGYITVRNNLKRKINTRN